MNITRIALLLTLPLVSLASWQAWGHHAFTAEFDKDAPINIVGSITKVEWINPHAWIHLRVTEEDGSTVDWMVEGGTPNTLLRAGINKRSMPVGSEIHVRGYQAKDKSCAPTCKANGRDITFADGRKAFMGSSGTGAPKDGTDPRDR
jgi:hypothetical protein